MPGRGRPKRRGRARSEHIREVGMTPTLSSAERPSEYGTFCWEETYVNNVFTRKSAMRSLIIASRRISASDEI
jgi:hypothetical protein